MLAVLGLSGLYRFGRFFGSIEWIIDYRRRRRFATAYAHVLGRQPATAERRRATREFFRRTRCDKLFYLIFDRIPRATAESLFAIENQPLLDAALARGHGVYVALSHHGSHHAAAMLLALRGYRVAGVRDRREGGLRRYVQDRFDQRYPEFRRMRVLFSDSFPRDIYRCFHEGYVVGSAMDVTRVRHANQKAEEVVIFGEKRLFLSGPLRVALRCRAPVLQAFIVPEPDFRYRLDIVGTLIDPREVEDEEAAVVEAMQTYTTNVAEYLRATPTLLSRV